MYFLKLGAGSRLPEVGRRDGCHLGGGRFVLGCWWTTLFLVRNGLNQCAAGSADLHRGRLSTTGKLLFKKSLLFSTKYICIL